MGIIRIIFLCWAFALLCGKANAIILFGLDNESNTSAPSGSAKLNSLPFNAVVKVYNNKNNNGTAVYLGNGYFITANHVFLSASTGAISLDGKTLYEIAPYFTPVKISSTVDAKIFHVDLKSEILSDLTAVSIYTSTLFSGTQVYLVAGGRGRAADSEIGSTSVKWGDYTTRSKRWGTNVISGRGTISDGNGMEYSGYITTLDSDAGNDEAALAEVDSGGAMFYYNIYRDKWYFVGMATGVSSETETSTFSSDTVEGDKNLFVNIGAYYSEINSIISNVPSGFDVYAYQNMPNTSAAERAANAIPYSDGITNLEKYALGLNMGRVASYSEIESFSIIAADGQASISFPLRSSATDVAATVYKSSNLADWIKIEASKTSESGDFGIWKATTESSVAAPIFFKIEFSK